MIRPARPSLTEVPLVDLSLRGKKLFEEVRLLLNDTDTIRSVSTVKLA
jgi:hypothetical protein